MCPINSRRLARPVLSGVRHPDSRSVWRLRFILSLFNLQTSSKSRYQILPLLVTVPGSLLPGCDYETNLPCELKQYAGPSLGGALLAHRKHTHTTEPRPTKVGRTP